jgi:hypothetical protein
MSEKALLPGPCQQLFTEDLEQDYANSIKKSSSLAAWITRNPCVCRAGSNLKTPRQFKYT